MDLEGKLEICINGGTFTHKNDLYVQVLIDGEKVWRTKKQDGYTPVWGSSTVKFIKGDYKTMTFILMDQDRFSKDDVIGQGEIALTKLMQGPIERIEVSSSNGKPVGTIDVHIEYTHQDVSVKQLMDSIKDKGP